MNFKGHIIDHNSRKDILSSRGILILLFIILFFLPKITFAQVITNTGASISVKSGTVVNTKDYENTVGALGNSGTINLSGNYSNNGLTGSLSNNGIFNLIGDYFNAGVSGGNGFFNLKGNWTNMGSFNPGTSTVTLNGTVNQTITHASTGENFYKLIINNPGRIITQIASSPSSLTILNDLDLTAGTLSLHSSTSNLTIGGKATINGSLIYNNTAKQTTSIADILSGSGTIDMSGGNLSHFLNLAGATNAIATFLSGSGSSTVNYNGINQTVFTALNYRNLIISNSGIKTLQGNSVVNLRLNISGGTFDLGTATSTLNVLGGTAINGGLSFNGTIFKTVTLNDSLTGSGFIDMSGGNQSHILNLWGSINSIGTYSSGTGSTVDYKKNGAQTAFSSDDYNNLKVTGTGLKTLTGDITAKGILTMSAGDIDANGNTLKVSNPAIAAILRTNGTVIGRLQRAVGFTGSDYLYPIGSAATYNPMKIRFHSLTSGPVTAQFKVADIGTVGLPLNDDDEQINDRALFGYWTLTSVSPMASNNYNVNLTTAGFTGIDLSSRIIKRTDGGTLEVDGRQDTTTVTLPDMKRDSLLKGISAITTDLAIGLGRPRITSQPVSMDICETFNAFFKVTATGHGSLSYRWQVDTGSGFVNVFDGGVYSGATSNRLVITGAPFSMNQYRYQCKITDAQGNQNITDPVILTVNKIPIAVATPPSQPVCNGISFTIAFSTANSVAGTLFNWSHNIPAGITALSPSTGSDFNQVSRIFTNNTDNPITVTFFITPVGPVTTHCLGGTITATVTINPTPRLFPIPPNTIQCDSTTTNIQLQSPSTFTSGFISFNFTVATTGPVTGFTSPSNGLPNNHIVADKLINHSDIFQDVTYSVVPVSPVAGCAVGAARSVKVTVNPTPRVRPINPPVLVADSSICFAGTTNILLTTPTVMTSGGIIFDYTVSAQGAVTGNMTPETSRLPGYFINRSYQNSSDTIQSVFFSITPKVDNAVCVKGPALVSQIRVHAKTLQSILITKPLTCAGGAGLAALRAVISKGANPYQVVWDGPFGYHKVDSLDIKNLGTGKYTVRVTDNRNCFRRDSISLSPVAAKAYISANVIPPGNYNISCIGSTDGTISIAVTGGITPPYIYWLVRNDIDTLTTGVFSDNLNITDPTTYRIITNLGAASYTLIIKDINGCEDSKKIVFRTPPLMVNWFSKSDFNSFNVHCKGYSDGWAKTDSTRGGRPGYTYRWYTFNGNIPGPINTNRIDNIPAGKYYLETKDVLNCIKIDSVIITEPTGMLLAGSQVSKSADNNFNISCNGGNDGSITLNVTGGSGIYDVKWTGPNGFTAVTKDISGLYASLIPYVATVKDLNGCDLMPKPTFTLTEPTPLAFTATKSVAVDGINNINCAGGKGSITLSVSGGSIGNYSYIWSTTNGSGIVQGQRDQFALTAGTYTVVVTDLNGCPSSKVITLTQPLPLITQLIPKQITCYPLGFSNGSINLTASGGMGSYSFSWSNGATTEDIANLTQGLYKVTVVDGNGCPKKDSTIIKLPPPLSISSNIPAFNGFNISCYGLADGSIKVTPTSGVAPFVYSWTGPGFTSTNQNITGLIKGQYTLNVIDSNLCTTSQIFNLNEPGKMSMVMTPSLSKFGNYNVNCVNDSTGKITIDPVNGVGTVGYHWADGNINKVRSGLPAGKYDIIIVDQNNCHADSSITLRQPDSIKTSFVVRQAFCPDSPDGEIQLHVTGGVIISDYMYRWSDNSTTQNLSDVLKGYYKVLVTDANNCSVKDSVLMEPLHETCLIIPNAISPNNDNINDVWNIGMIYLYPKVEITVFNRWGETLWKSESGYPNPWDGRSKGALLPIDSYFYIIDLHNGSRPISGNITIVR